MQTVPLDNDKTCQKNAFQWLPWLHFSVHGERSVGRTERIWLVTLGKLHPWPITKRLQHIARWHVVLNDFKQKLTFTVNEFNTVRWVCWPKIPDVSALTAICVLTLHIFFVCFLSGFGPLHLLCRFMLPRKVLLPYGTEHLFRRWDSNWSAWHSICRICWESIYIYIWINIRMDHFWIMWLGPETSSLCSSFIHGVLHLGGTVSQLKHGVPKLSKVFQIKFLRNVTCKPSYRRYFAKGKCVLALSSLMTKPQAKLCSKLYGVLAKSIDCLRWQGWFHILCDLCVEIFMRARMVAGAKTYLEMCARNYQYHKSTTPQLRNEPIRHA